MSKSFFLTMALILWTGSALADDDVVQGKLHYRGFVVDVSEAEALSNFPAIEDSIKHQLDIVADCGAKDETLSFFRVPPIAVRLHPNDPPGDWREGVGAEIEAAELPPQKPIILHELLHAYQFRKIPMGFRNSDIERFYSIAKQNALYRADSYTLKIRKNFFAVTASLYLSGAVDRPPYTREALKRAQPNYYEWLADLFGVQK